MKNTKKNPMEAINIIPALPGWTAVVPLHDRNTVSKVVGICKHPIVAWHLEIEVLQPTADRPDGDLTPITTIFPVPITVEGITETGVIGNPDGTFIAPHICSLYTEEDVLRYFREEEETA